MDKKTTVTIAADRKLDVTGLNCPLPVLKTKVLLNTMQPGEILCVEATDPHAVIDFEAYCARTRHELVKIVEVGNLFKFYIKLASHKD